MTRKNWRRVCGPIVFVALSAPFLANCGAKMPDVPGAPGIPGVAKCPDMNADAIASFDFEHEFKLKADVAAKIKAGVGASVEMKALADRIDGDLKTACSKLVVDLGGKGDFANGTDACKAAASAVGDAKAKLGASVSVKIDVTEPHCGVSVDAYADCAGKCDATVKPGSVEAMCEGGKLQGSCSGKCDGECEASAAVACSGECDGSCDADVSGSCSGKCDGKCDGKATTGAAAASCSGKCEGKCSGNVKGSCKGKCGGSCHASAAASCSGTCTGKCDVKMTAPKCTGHVTPPQMSAECNAKCNASVHAKAECTPPHLRVLLVGSGDATAMAKFRAVVEKDLPMILTVALGIGKQAVEVAGNMKVVIDGVQAGISGATSDAVAGGQLAACVAAPFKGALDAVAGVSASVNVSVSVQASASGSASGKAG
jgi:hypothetical protein